MSNEIRIVVTGENKASPAIKSVGTDSDKAARSVKDLAEKTDQLDESGGHATSSLGALGSGFELIGKTNVQDKLNQVALATDFMSGIGEGATLVMDKFGGTLSKLKNPAEALKGGLGKLKEGFSDAGSTAGKFTTGALAAGAAVAALVVVNGTLNAVLHDKVNISMHDTVAGLQEIASTGKISSDSLAGISGSTKTLKDDLDTLNSGPMQSLENFSHKGFFASDKVFGNDIDNSRKRIKGLDDALTQMVSNGNLEQAQSAFAQIAAEAKKQGVSVDDLAKGFPGYTEAVKNAADGDQTLTGSADDATSALEDQADAVTRVSNSLKASTDPLFAVYDAQDQLTGATDDYNKALKEHGKNSKEAQKANIALDKATINMVSTLGAASSSTGHLTQEQKGLLASAGTSKTRIKQLDDALYAAWKQANKLDGFNVDVTIAQHFKMFGKPYSQAGIDSGNIGGLASGGVKGAASGMSGTGATWVGENGPEILDLPAGSTVRSHGDSMRTMQQGDAGPTTVILKFDPSGAPGLIGELFKSMRLEIAAQGGNVQQVLGVVGK